MSIPRSSVRHPKPPPVKEVTPRASASAAAGSPRANAVNQSINQSNDEPTPRPTRRKDRSFSVIPAIPAPMPENRNTGTIGQSSDARVINQHPLRLVWQGIELIGQPEVNVPRPSTFGDLIKLVNEHFRSVEAREADSELAPFYFTDAHRQQINERNYADVVLMCHPSRKDSVDLLLVFDEPGSFDPIREYEQQVEYTPHPNILYAAEYHSAARQGEKPLAYAMGEFIDNCLSAFDKVRMQQRDFCGEISIRFHESAVRSSSNSVTKSQLRILIEDNGCGMDSKALTSFARVADAPESRGDLRLGPAIAADAVNNYVNQSISQFGVGAKFAAFYLSKGLVVSSRPMGSQTVFEMKMNKEEMDLQYSETGNAFRNNILTRPVGSIDQTKLPTKLQTGQTDHILTNVLNQEVNQKNFTRILLDYVDTDHLPEIQLKSGLLTKLAGLYHRTLYGPWGRGQDDANKQTKFYPPRISLAYFKDNTEIWKCEDLSKNENDIQSAYYKNHRGDIFRFAMLTKLNDSLAQFWIRGEILYFPRDMDGETNPALQDVSDPESGANQRDGENYRTSFQSLQFMFNLLWHGRLIPLSHCPSLYFMNSIVTAYGKDTLQRMHGFLHVAHPLLTDRVKLHMSQDLSAYLTRGDNKRPTDTVIVDLELEPNALSAQPRARNNRAQALKSSFKAQVDKWVLLDAAIKFSRSDLLSELSRNETKAIYSKVSISTNDGPFNCGRGSLIAFKEGVSKVFKFLRVCCVLSDIQAGTALQAAENTVQLSAKNKECFAIGFVEPVLTAEVSGTFVNRFDKPQSNDLAILQVTTFKNKPLNSIQQTYAKRRLCRVPLRNIQTDMDSQSVEQAYNRSNNAAAGWPTVIKVYDSNDKQLDDGLIIRGRCGLKLPGTLVRAFDEAGKFVKDETVTQTFYRVANGADGILDYAECERVDLSLDSDEDNDGDVSMEDAEPASGRRSSLRQRSASVARGSSVAKSSVLQTPMTSKKRARVKPEPASMPSNKRIQRHPLCAFRKPDYSISRQMEYRHEAKAAIVSDSKSASGFTEYRWDKPGVYQVEWVLKSKISEGDRNEVAPVTVTIVIVPDLPHRFKILDVPEPLSMGVVQSSPLRIEMFDKHGNAVTPTSMRGGRFPVLQAELQCLEDNLRVECEQPVLQASEGDSEYVIDGFKFVPEPSFRLSSSAGQEVMCQLSFYDGNDRENALGHVEFETKLIPGDQIDLNLDAFPTQLSLKNGDRFQFKLSQCDQFGQPAAKRLQKFRGVPQPSIAYPRVMLQSSSEELSASWGDGKIGRESFDEEGYIDQDSFASLPPIWVPSSAFLDQQSVELTIQATCEWEPRKSVDITSRITVLPRKELAFVSISSSARSVPPIQRDGPPLKLQSSLNAPLNLFVHFFTEDGKSIDLPTLRRRPEVVELQSQIRIEVKGLEDVGETPFFCSMEDLHDDGRIPDLRTPKKPAPVQLSGGLQCELAIVLDGDADEVDVSSVKSRLRYRLKHDYLRVNFAVECKAGPPAKVVLEFPFLSGYKCGSLFGERVHIRFTDKDDYPVSLKSKQALSLVLSIDFRGSRAIVKGLQPVAVSCADDNDLVSHFTVSSASMQGKVGMYQFRIMTQSTALKLDPSDYVEFEMKPGSPHSMRAFVLPSPGGDSGLVEVTEDCVLPDRVLIDRLTIQMYDEMDNVTTIQPSDQAVFAHFVDAQDKVVSVSDKAQKMTDRVSVIVNRKEVQQLKFQPFVLRATAGEPLKLVIQVNDPKTRQHRTSNPCPLKLSLTVVPLPGRVRAIENLYLTFRHVDLNESQRLSLDPSLVSDLDGEAPGKVLAGSSVTQLGFNVLWTKDPIQSIFLANGAAANPPPVEQFVASWINPSGNDLQLTYNRQWDSLFSRIILVPSSPLVLNAAGDWSCSVRHEESRPAISSVLSPNERVVKALQSHVEHVYPGPPSKLFLPQQNIPPVTNQPNGSRTIATQLKLTLCDQFDKPALLTQLSDQIRELLPRIRTAVRPVDAQVAQQVVPKVDFGQAVVDLSTPFATIMFNSISVEANTVAPNGDYELVFQMMPPFDSLGATLRFTFSDDTARIAALNRENQKRDQARAQLTLAKQDFTQRHAAHMNKENLVKAKMANWQKDYNNLHQSIIQELHKLNQDLRHVPEFDFNAWTRTMEGYKQRAAAMTQGPVGLGMLQKLQELYGLVNRVRESAVVGTQQHFPCVLPRHLQFKNAAGQPLGLAEGFIGVLGSLVFVDDVQLCRAVSFCRASDLQCPLVTKRSCPAFSLINSQFTQSGRRGRIMMVEGQGRRNLPNQLPHEQARISSASVTGNPRYLINLINFPPDENHDAVRNAFASSFGNLMVINTMQDLDAYRQLLRSANANIPSIIAIQECRERSANNVEQVGAGTDAPSFERLEVRIAVRPSPGLVDWVNRLAAERGALKIFITAANHLDSQLVNENIAEQRTQIMLAQQALQAEQERLQKQESELTVSLRPVAQRGNIPTAQPHHMTSRRTR